jgi:hypothetical protein
MGTRRSWENAHSPYWSLHVEAWRRSRLSRMEYCARHGLKTKTFARWMKHLIGVEEARKHTAELRELRRKERLQKREKGGGETPPRPRFGARTDMRSRAVQAYWAMHVEVLNWSGMSVRDYANALLLSPWPFASGMPGSTTARSRSTGGRTFIRAPALGLVLGLTIVLRSRPSKDP